MSNDLTKYVTTKQAAEMLGVVPTSINHLLMADRLKGMKLGHYWLVYVPSIEKYDDHKSGKGRPRSKAPKVEEE